MHLMRVLISLPIEMKIKTNKVEMERNNKIKEKEEDKVYDVLEEIKSTRSSGSDDENQLLDNEGDESFSNINFDRLDKFSSMEIDRKRKIGTLKTKDSKERRKSLSSCGDTEFIEENIGKLECSICSLLIGDDNLACGSCHNSFCTKCIKEWMDKEQSCPKCKIQLKPEDLKKNVSYTQAIEESQIRFKKYLARIKPSQDCKEHNSPSELYCVDCKRIICSDCLVSGKHCGHTYSYFKERFEYLANGIDTVKSLFEAYLKFYSEDIEKLNDVLKLKAEDIDNLKDGLISKITEIITQKANEYKETLENTETFTRSQEKIWANMEKRREKLQGVLESEPTIETLGIMEKKLLYYKNSYKERNSTFYEFVHSTKNKNIMNSKNESKDNKEDEEIKESNIYNKNIEIKEEYEFHKTNYMDMSDEVKTFRQKRRHLKKFMISQIISLISQIKEV